MSNDLKENLLWFYSTPSLKEFYLGLFLFFLFCMICLFFPYQKNKIYYGQVLLENKIFLLVEEQNRIYLKDSYEIDEKNTKCSLEKTNKEYLISDNKKYFEIYLDCDLKDKYIENQIVEVKILLQKTTLFDTLKNKIKKGLTT